MKVLITGANGFVGKNFCQKLKEQKIEYLTYTREHSYIDLEMSVQKADIIFHLAGVNRPKDESEFRRGNTVLTQELCKVLEETNKSTPVVYSSSIQADNDSLYGKSKKEAEDALELLSRCNGNPIYNLRLPNVFGKWSKPNYNSAVATFCHNVINDIPINIHDPDAMVNLVYIDDVVRHFIDIINHVGGEEPEVEVDYYQVRPTYRISVGELADQIQAFKKSKESLIIERVGNGLTRALYSTYLSHFPTNQFSYPLIKHEDSRGVFVEMLKTKDAGQFSFFSAHPGITRGGHYHHSKNEKFLVVKGKARFCFRHIKTGETYSLETSDEIPEVVETVPGWSHDITNVGDDEMFVMLWANEIFDPENPDTFAHKV